MDALDVPAGAVVVGVDGSARAGRALELATHEAARRGTGLHVVYAFPWLATAHGWEFAPEADALETAGRVVADAVDRASAMRADLTVTGQVVVDDPAVVLVEASDRASLVVVVGARGLGPVAGQLLGSVSQKVAAHARGPVLVVREEAVEDGGPVAVGADPAGETPEVMESAFEEAVRRRTGVRVVLATERESVPPAYADDQVLDLLREATTQTRQRTSAEVRAWAARYPGVPVEEVFVHQHPVEALVQVAGRASVVVVGSRGRRGLRGVRLGSVARGVLHRAPLVLVVRVHQERV
ncbi:nucleotide-binding universal stress UspA family protein [Georgenia soli]|uniref:Nucleotide-binding universal stress UspA family protein n=1 Tax=Georgenia soli TaxID=638953 RepID=A0A2A9EG87_9MICO|nr:universal stress protein [Georgenia soli]PFG38077.1 nucleotide-binding universal stress UspA family protein [Georgenia soli]